MLAYEYHHTTIFLTVLISVLWATVLSFMSSRAGAVHQFLTQVSGSTTAVSLLTTPLALLLILRAKMSLGWLLEARLLWGRLLSITFPDVIRSKQHVHASTICTQRNHCSRMTLCPVGMDCQSTCSWQIN
jgi:predicted membrane chloride channel (bestrophin family)